MKNKHKNDKRRQKISIPTTKNNKNWMKSKPLRNPIYIKDIYINKKISIIIIIIYFSIIQYIYTNKINDLNFHSFLNI